MGAPLVPCIAVSTFYVLLTCALCEILRKVVDAALPNGLAKTALNEAIAGAELCGCGFELIISKFLQKKKYSNKLSMKALVEKDILMKNKKKR